MGKITEENKNDHGPRCLKMRKLKDDRVTISNAQGLPEGMGHMPRVQGTEDKNNRCNLQRGIWELKFGRRIQW